MLFIPLLLNKRISVFRKILGLAHPFEQGDLTCSKVVFLAMDQITP